MSFDNDIFRILCTRILASRRSRLLLHFANLFTPDLSLYSSFDKMQPTGSLEGKRVLVTAGAQGIGLAISRALLEAGARVCVQYFSSAATAAALAAESPGRVHVVCADLTTKAGCDDAVGAAVAALGGLDILVNNAGALLARASIEDGDDDLWRETMALNVDSAVRVTRAATPHLAAAAAEAGGAAIVNLASLAGRKGGHGGSLAYATSKGAILTFTRALAAELGPKGIRVNAVAPGLILGTNFHATHTTPESAAATVASLPLGRAGEPEDVARAVVFLAGEWRGFITGATLDINGGAWAG